MGKRVIINVDDFGMNAQINQGIIQLFGLNCISSTSLMATMPNAEEAIHLAKENHLTNVGLHLDVTEGVKLLPLKPYMMMQVKYHKNPEKFKKKLGELIEPEEILAECQRQYTWALDHGLEPDHIDFHHGLMSNPLMRPLMLEWIGKLRKPIRRDSTLTQDIFSKFGIKTPDRLEMSFYGAKSTKKQLTKILSRVKDGETVEIMSHAGYNDPTLEQTFFQSLTHPRREKELNVLKHPDIRNIIEQKGIDLIGFGEL